MIIESFDGQKEGEEIVAVWRQHPWVLARPSLIAIALILIGSVPMPFQFSYQLGLKRNLVVWLT